MALACLILVACSGQNQPVISNKPAPQEFSAEGKIALDCPRCDPYRGCKNEPFSANISWLHQQSSNELQFFDPLGKEVLFLRYQNDGSVNIRENNAERTTSVQELAQELGISIPVNSAATWIFSYQGTNPRYQEQNWQVEAKNWQNQGFYQRLNL